MLNQTFAKKLETMSLKLSNFFTKRTRFVHLLFFIILFPCTVTSDKHSSNNIQKSKYNMDTSFSEDYPSLPASPPTGGCNSCKHREELKKQNLNLLREEILRRMGFSQAPNITGKVLPQIPPQYLAQIEEEQGMQSDQPFKYTVTEEDDDFHAKTQKILTFAERYPRLRHSWKGHDVLYFPFTDSITKYHVANATLNLFLRTNNERRSQSDILIEIYKVHKLGDHSEPPILVKVQSKKETPSPGRGQWFQIDLTQTVGEWFKYSRDNFGFVINATVNGKKLAMVDISAERSKAPFVEISVMEPKRRKRRNVGLNCDDKASEPLCCRYSFIVDFVEIGLDFIIAPKRYDAHMCSGECPYLTLQKYPHTHLLKMSSPNSAAPCCAPRKMSPIHMLYFDEKVNVVFANLPGMVVDRCGCS
ncbi:growth/differentiation factor 8-like [Sitophilus oryzae]|uniref:Growth/differentiation factor 8-like n=1 Tax=Sitophilus oryzae TaxID=7048 RepID=A0A6J2Y9N4_SITOR|nr:growth/differentiation factor 8-like [Sitophilus oryzae]